MTKTPLLVKVSNFVSDTEAALLGGKPGKLMKTRYGKFYCVDKYTPIQFTSWWERLVKDEVSKCQGLFVDIGANVGLYTIIAALNGCHVLAIEPSPYTNKILNDNVKLNHVEHLVDVSHVAAWDKIEYPLHLSQNKDSGLNSVSWEGQETRGVPVDFLLNGDAPSLIKIDTERTEPKVLQGLRKTLTSSSPPVIFEAWSLEDLTASTDILKDCGYRNYRQLGRIVWVATKPSQQNRGRI